MRKRIGIDAEKDAKRQLGQEHGRGKVSARFAVERGRVQRNGRARTGEKEMARCRGRDGKSEHGGRWTRKTRRSGGSREPSHTKLEEPASETKSKRDENQPESRPSRHEKV